MKAPRLSPPEVNPLVHPTDRRQARDALTSSASLLAKTQSMTHLGNWAWAMRDNTMTWSDEVYRIFGLAPQQTPATYGGFLDHIHPQHRPQVIQSMQQALSDTQHDYRSEHWVTRPDGSIRIVVEQGEIIRDAVGQPLRMEGTIQDVTDTRQVEQELFHYKERFKNVFRFSCLGIVIVTLDGYLFESNAALRTFLGYGKTELHGMHILDLTHPDDQEATAQRLTDLRTRKVMSKTIERRFLHKDGHIVWGKTFISVMRDAEETPTFLFAMIQDITEKRMLQQALSHIQEEVEIRERQRLASTIHDGAIQLLQVMLLRTKSVLEGMRRGQPVPLEMMESTCQGMTNAIEQLRDLSTDLHPSFLEQMTLAEVVRWKCEKLATQSAIVVHVTAEEELGTLDNKIKRNAYFIIQEAVTNAIKHAQCTQIEVLLRKTSDAILCLHIADNGQGFAWETAQKERKGIGLALIEERAARIHGTVHFFSAPHKGTTLVVRIALND
ncbi:MAG: PAS domain S-box protein [Magnetococcales bacterium]|nr:PAS domain S-box protein [Magnetococcales bacterium]